MKKYKTSFNYYNVSQVALAISLSILATAEETTQNTSVPVTSHRTDVHDDPESLYTDAPALDWKLFGNRTRLITRFHNQAIGYRNLLKDGFVVDALKSTEIDVPIKWPWLHEAITGSKMGTEISKTPIPIIFSTELGKSIYPPGTDESPHNFKLEDIRKFQEAYPNVIYAGGRVDEADDMIHWTHKQFYERFPVSPSQTTFPAAFQDKLEACSKRSGAPYIYFQHNAMWAMPYTGNARITSMVDAQIMARDSHVILPQLALVRSVTRQHPGAHGIQFSGQVNLNVSNPTEVITQAATPIWSLRDNEPAEDVQYSKSYPLSRQLLYYSWLNGANYVRFETGYGSIENGNYIPSPLALFTQKADKVIERVGFTGPVQTPIALINEFSHVWDKPHVHPSHRIIFENLGVPYKSGDYQHHGLIDFFYPFYLQTGTPYAKSMREDYSITPTPYGSSVDFMHSDARPEALKRYGLLIWAGVPPTSPSLVRDKLLGYIHEQKGRVIVFGETARTLFPNLFADKELVEKGVQIEYDGSTFSEDYDFTIEQLVDTKGMRVLATVNGKPLVVECHGGLVMVLSEYGLNHTEHVASDNATWVDDEIISNIPHKLLEHAKRVLDKEARKQDLFRVGNSSLTHIVTRPKSGEYLLGLFNDKTTSEEFNITSQIGEIQSLEEIALDDGKDLLKSAANGAGYVEPRIRQSTTSPLDYGLSDASHIEGRDFRLFRIKLKETGVREIDKFKFPKRIAGTLVSVPSLTGIRSYLQGFPSFLQDFEGIKITGSALLDMDPIWIKEESYWLNRRGIRVVVDSRGLTDEDSIKVIEKLSLLGKLPKDMVTESKNEKLTETAKSASVGIISADTVNYLTTLSHRTNTKAKLNILNLFYRDEDSLYQDYTHFKGGSALEKLKGKEDSSSLIGHLAETTNTASDFIYIGMDIQDLGSLVEYDAANLTKYKGIKIDSTYLLSKSTEALAKDAAILKKHNLSVIVDLRRDQFHIDRITFYPHFAHYAKGMEMFKNIASKMPVIGAQDLIVGVSDMYISAPFMNTQRDQAWVEFAKIAAPAGVNLHLISKTPNAPLTESADMTLANVYVIKGLPSGKASPYRLKADDGSETGEGAVLIHDADRGIYFGEN